MRRQSEWIQFEVKRAGGSEDLLIIRHAGRTFRINESKSVGEVLLGCVEGWTQLRRKPPQADPDPRTEWRHWSTSSRRARRP